MENKYERVVAINVDTGEELANVFIKKGESIEMQTRKNLSDGQKDYLQKKDFMGELSKSLGGYVHVFYVKDD